MDSTTHHHGDARASTPPPLHAQEEGEGEGVEGDAGEGRRPVLLLLEQIRVSRGSNDYTDSPTALPAPASGGSSEHLYEPPSPGGMEEEGEALQDPVWTQPKADPSPPLPLKPVVAAGGGRGSHRRRCVACGRCVCTACMRSPPLPSCWACGRRCVCSPRGTVDCLTCACCVRALFYHCSMDDEDTCADRPFSCTEDHCCARWTAVSLLALLMPCLLCHLPARATLAACQACYGRAARPGCRCRRPRPGPAPDAHA